MKRTTLIVLGVLIVCGLCVYAATFTTPVQVSLQWNYPTNAMSADTSFLFVSNNSLGQPLTAWPVFTNVLAANLGSTNLDVTGTNYIFTLPFVTLPGQGFYVGQASNFWGVSDFSTVASTPPAPRSDANLRITRP